MTGRFKVEICATLLVDKPPKLPLREEVMSLGFEVIYNAEGVGEELAFHEAERAVERFRREENYREAKKLRIFPRSAERAQQKEALRLQREEELKAPHAFSYESYQQELYQTLGQSFDSATRIVDKLSKSYTDDPDLSRKSNRFRQLVRARRMKSKGWLPKGKGAGDHGATQGPTGVLLLKQSSPRGGNAVDAALAEAGFRDILLTVRSEETAATERTRGSATAHDSPVAARHGDAALRDMEIAFSDAETDKQRGSSKTNAALDKDVMNAFADVDSETKDASGGTKRRFSKEETDTNVSQLLDLVNLPATQISQIELLLNKDPELLQVKQNDRDRLPLHTLCQRQMPDRSAEPITTMTDLLVQDIQDFKSLIELFVGFYPEACSTLDRKRDLPVHLTARTLMEWEAVWYECVYSEAAEENDSNGKITLAISNLYQSMSECIEIVLQPVCASSKLCQEPGSVGEIFPLHIAAIFTATVPTLRRTLESYPQAAGLPCKLGDMTTFVPADSLPLQLHEELSTDFPKWETETKEKSDQNIKWSRPSSGTPDADDRIKRSDLLFAYYPHIEPARVEKTRVRNLESLVRFEALQVTSVKSRSMSKASQRLWRWMCMFTEPDSGRATYVNSVQRVLEGLPYQAVKYLAFMKTGAGESVINEAATDCSTVIRRRLREVEATFVSVSRTYNHRSWQEEQWGRIFNVLRGQMALLCRSIFNVQAGTFPTTFVVLPYELAQNPDGSLGMADPAALKIAVKFAESLLKLTEPVSILQILEKKSVEHYNQSLFEGSHTNPFEREEKQNHAEELKSKMIQLYRDQKKGYLYLIDEATGTPVFSNKSSECDASYPIVINEPAVTVEKLFPLMLVGMTLMRGGKALPVLLDVLLDETITTIPQNWLETASELIASLDTDVSDPETSKDLLELKDDLTSFTSDANKKLKRSVEPENKTSEWVSERSIIKMLLEIHDQHFTFAGLSIRSSDDLGLIWTKGAENHKIDTDQNLAKSQIISIREDELANGGASIKETRSFDLEERINASFPDVLAVEQMDAGLTGWVSKVTKTHKTEPGKLRKMQRSASHESGRRSRADRDSDGSIRSRSEDNHKRRRQSMKMRQDSQKVGSARRRRGDTHQRLGASAKAKKSGEETHMRRSFQNEGRPTIRYSKYSKKPDVSEVAKKFEELTKKHVMMNSYSMGRAPLESAAEPVEHREPASGSRKTSVSDKPYVIDLTDIRTPSMMDTTDGSSSAEDLVLLQSVAGSESHVVSSSDAEVSDLVSRTRSLVARANRKSDEFFWGRRQEKEFCHQHSMLFDELAFTITASEDLLEKPKKPKREATESTRIWHELKHQLDANNIIDDHQTLMLKVQLAAEAKKMAEIGRQVEGVARQEMIACERQSEMLAQVSSLDDNEVYSSNQSLSRTRRLLIRLCDLEDRLLCDDIEIQHLTLEVLSVNMKVNEVHEDLFGFPVGDSPTLPSPPFIPPEEIHIHAFEADNSEASSSVKGRSRFISNTNI